MSDERLVVNPILCDAYGHCAELLPELIELDDWGYPIIADETVPRHLHTEARRAVAACPRLALRLERHRAGHEVTSDRAQKAQPRVAAHLRLIAGGQVRRVAGDTV
jgi:ferredoxin